MSLIISKEAVRRVKWGGPINRYRVSSAGKRIRTTERESHLVVGLFDHVPDDLPGKQTGSRRSRNRSPRQKLRKGCFKSGLTRYLLGATYVEEAEKFSSELRVLGYWKTKIARWLKNIGDAKVIATACVRLGWKPSVPVFDPVRSFLTRGRCCRHLFLRSRPAGFRTELWPIEYAGDRFTGRSNENVPSSPSEGPKIREPTRYIPQNEDGRCPNLAHPFDRECLECDSSWGLSVEACENGDFVVSLPRRLPGRRWIYRALFPELGYWVLDKFLRDTGFVPGDPFATTGGQVFWWRPDYLGEDIVFFDYEISEIVYTKLETGAYVLEYFG